MATTAFRHWDSYLGDYVVDEVDELRRPLSSQEAAYWASLDPWGTEQIADSLATTNVEAPTERKIMERIEYRIVVKSDHSDRWHPWLGGSYSSVTVAGAALKRVRTANPHRSYQLQSRTVTVGPWFAPVNESDEE